MDSIEIMVRDGAAFWAAGSNGTILSVDRERLRAAGHAPESICPAFKEHPRIALKIVHKSMAKGIAEDERKLQALAVSLIEEMGVGQKVRIPRIFSGGEFSTGQHWACCAVSCPALRQALKC